MTIAGGIGVRQRVEIYTGCQFNREISMRKRTRTIPKLTAEERERAEAVLFRGFATLHVITRVPEDQRTYQDTWIDGHFFFRFDREWMAAIEKIRLQFPVQSQPVETADQDRHRESGYNRRQLEYEQTVAELMAQFGLNDMEMVSAHIQGRGGVYWPHMVAGGTKRDELALPYVEIRVYSFGQLAPNQWTERKDIVH